MAINSLFMALSYFRRTSLEDELTASKFRSQYDS